MYTLSIGIKSSHPAKSTAASTAGGCWPTETKQTCRPVQLQSLPLIWKGKGSCEPRSDLRHQMKGVIQPRHRRPPGRHWSKSPEVLMCGQRRPMHLSSRSFEGKMAVLQPGPGAASPEVSGSLSTDVSGLWMAPLGFPGPRALVLLRARCRERQVKLRWAWGREGDSKKGKGLLKGSWIFSLLLSCVDTG